MSDLSSKFVPTENVVIMVTNEPVPNQVRIFHIKKPDEKRNHFIPKYKGLNDCDIRPPGYYQFRSK